MTRNYQLVYYVEQKCVNYRDTSVSKNSFWCHKIVHSSNIAIILDFYQNSSPPPT